MGDAIQLDILLKADDAPETVTVENVHRARPPSELVERCRRWIASRGLECHATGFGLACSGSPEAVRSVFGDGPDYRAPAEIAAHVEQITETRPPELF